MRRWNSKRIQEQLPVSSLGNWVGGKASCWDRDNRRKSRFEVGKDGSKLDIVVLEQSVAVAVKNLGQEL